MVVSFKNLYTFPGLVPIPQLNCHVVGSCEDERLRRVDDNRPDVIWMRFKRCDLLGGVIVVDAELKVIGTADNPIFSGNEPASSDRDISKLKCLDNRLHRRLESLETDFYVESVLTWVS